MEIWRTIPGHDHYEVSDYGRVRSNARRSFPNKMLKPVPRGKGHLQVCLDRGQWRLLHQLVLEAFVGPRPLGLLALHRDGDVNNNRVENLYWGTYSDNLHDAVRHGTHHNAKKDECKYGHPLDRVSVVTLSDGTIKRQRYCTICHNAAGRDYKRDHREPVELPYGRARLTPEQVAAIREDGRAMRVVAADYGISHTTVRKIRNGAAGLGWTEESERKRRRTQKR